MSEEKEAAYDEEDEMGTVDIDEDEAAAADNDENEEAAADNDKVEEAAADYIGAAANDAQAMMAGDAQQEEKANQNIHDCSICMDRQATMALSLCGHAGFCFVCLVASEKTCPFCRIRSKILLTPSRCI